MSIARGIVTICALAAFGLASAGCGVKSAPVRPDDRYPGVYPKPLPKLEPPAASTQRDRRVPANQPGSIYSYPNSAPRQ